MTPVINTNCLMQDFKQHCKILQEDLTQSLTLYEKNPNTEFFLVRIFLYSVRMLENTDQKKLRIWRLFTQCEEYVQHSL